MSRVKRQPKQDHWTDACPIHIYRTARDMELWNELLRTTPRRISETALITEGIYLLHHCLQSSGAISFTRREITEELQLIPFVQSVNQQFLDERIYDPSRRSAS